MQDSSKPSYMFKRLSESHNILIQDFKVAFEDILSHKGEGTVLLEEHQSLINK